MSNFLFDLDSGEPGIQPMVVTCSTEYLVERQFGTTISEAVENALWQSGYSGTLSGRLNLAEEMKRRFLQDFRNDPAFGADLTRGTDLRGNLDRLLVSWAKDAARSR